eukprot:3519790-Amphidinium_carterae.1
MQVQQCNAADDDLFVEGAHPCDDQHPHYIHKETQHTSLEIPIKSYACFYPPLKFPTCVRVPCC